MTCHQVWGGLPLKRSHDLPPGVGGFTVTSRFGKRPLMTSPVGVSTCDVTWWHVTGPLADVRSGSAGTAGPYRGDGSMAAHHPAQGEGHVGVRGGGGPLEAVEPVGPVRLWLGVSDVLPDSSDP